MWTESRTHWGLDLRENLLLKNHCYYYVVKIQLLHCIVLVKWVSCESTCFFYKRERRTMTKLERVLRVKPHNLDPSLPLLNGSSTEPDEGKLHIDCPFVSQWCTYPCKEGRDGRTEVRWNLSPVCTLDGEGTGKGKKGMLCDPGLLGWETETDSVKQRRIRRDWSSSLTP